MIIHIFADGTTATSTERRRVPLKLLEKVVEIAQEKHEEKEERREKANA